MSSDGCLNHLGLISAIGSCSDETKAILNKALAYLGISYATPNQRSKQNSSFVLSLRRTTADKGTEQIEFDDETKSWHCTAEAESATDEASPPSLIPVAHQVPLEGGRTCNDASSSLLNEVPEDWTTLLPLTDHVNFLKSREWHKTTLGPMLQWPTSLRLMTMKMLGDPRPANIYWGPTHIAIYNEPFSVIAASRHPMMMGSTAEVAMPMTYPFLSQVFDKIEKTGTAFSTPEFEMEVEKVAGFVEEAWYDGIFSPIRDVDGTFLGLYNSGYEITTHRMARRNADIIHRIASGPAASETSSWHHIVHECSSFDRDVPFLVLYSVDDQEPVESGRLMINYQGSLGIDLGHPALPRSLDINQGNQGFMPLFRAAKAKGSFTVLDMPNGKLPDFLANDVHWRGHGDPCTHIVASPLFVNGLTTGFLVIGLNPRRPYDDAHKQFVEDIIRVSNGLLAFGTSVKQAERREKQLTNELTYRQRFLQRIAEVATVGLYSQSSDGLLTWANPTFFDISGVTQKSEDRYNWQGVNYVHDDDQEEVISCFNQCLETKMVCTLELRLKKTWRPPESDHDEPCWIMTTLAPNVENDKAVGVIGCVTSISHLKWAEKFQMEMAEAAKLAKLQQERFIDVTSHEMRNPLSAILQCADDIATLATVNEFANEDDQDSSHMEAFQAILENAKSILFCARHQNRIVDDILTVSKLDSSMLTVSPVVMSPQTVVVQTMQAFANKLAADDIQSRLEVQEGYIDFQIAYTHGDPSRIAQILINLIDNAIKFTKNAQRREICIRINALKQCSLLADFGNRVQWFPSKAQLAKYGDPVTSEAVDETLYIMFEVEDSGEGMSEEETNGLFNRFTQASPKTHITYGGSGLGLFISRELVELQGGMIGVSSQPGVGSVFAFFIESRKAESVDTTQPQTDHATWYEGMNVSRKAERKSSIAEQRSNAETQRPSHSGLPSRPKYSNSWSILFVEDNLINQKVLRKQLERLGCVVRVANHGIEALDLIKKSAHWKDNRSSSIEFDVVLMDWEMPIMDGITCTKRIREMEAEDFITKHLLIVGATANARPEQVEVALSAGMDGLITKPFTVTALIEKIESLLT